MSDEYRDALQKKYEEQFAELEQSMIAFRARIEEILVTMYQLLEAMSELVQDRLEALLEPEPLEHWSRQKKQLYADNEGRSAKTGGEGPGAA